MKFPIEITKNSPDSNSHGWYIADIMASDNFNQPLSMGAAMVRKTQKIFLLILPVVILAAAGCSAGGNRTVFYVAPDGRDNNPGTKDRPFTTPARAQDAVRILVGPGLDRDIIVYFRAGSYFLSEPLVLDSRDSGTETFRITYAAAPGEKVVFSGGRFLTGWQRTDSNSNLWKLSPPDAKTEKWRFRQLFAGDERLTRARWPNGDDLLTIKTVDEKFQTFKIDPPPVADISADSDVEAVFYRSWCTSRVLVESLQGDTLITRVPATPLGHPNVPKKGRKLFLENARQFLDQPGEWFFDRAEGVLYYMARPGEKPDQMRFVAPIIEQLLALRGSAERPIQNVYFRGIEFAHTEWQLPEFGFRDIQTGQHGPHYQTAPSYALTPTVLLTYASRCSITAARIAHCGAAGVALGRGCRDNRIAGCEFYDVGGNAVMVGWHGQEDAVRGQWMHGLNPDWSDPADAPDGNEISDNFIHHCGTVQFGGVGVWVAFSPRTRIIHNLICDLPYTGLSAGFIWNDSPTSQKENVIAFNYIHHIMQKMNDGGGIYTLGSQPGTVIHHNLIHDSGGRGLYTDEGSSYILLENNLLYRLGDYAYLHHYGHYNIVRNNIFASAEKNCVDRYRGDAETSLTLSRNIFWMDRGDGPLAGVFNDNKFNFDYNLYWDSRNHPVLFDGQSFEQWQQCGQDAHSIIANPHFADPANSDFTLPPDSPAFQLGFEPIDLTTVGPRPPYREHFKSSAAAFHR
jgi:hypothetical protein